MYFVLPNCSIVHNPRVAGMSIAQSVMKTFYPLFCSDEFSPADYLRICPKTDVPSAISLLLVRNPIDRFISSVVGAEIDVDIAVNGLGNGLELDLHFAPQSNFIATNSFSFDSGMVAFCTAAGLSYPLPIINKTRQEKPTLNDSQLAIVQEFYASDINLYNSLGNS